MSEAVRHAANDAIAAIRALEEDDVDRARRLAIAAATQYGEEPGYMAARGLALTYGVQHLGRLPRPGEEAAAYPSDGIGPGAAREANACAMVAAAVNGDIVGGRRLWHLLDAHARRQVVADLVSFVAWLARQRGAGHPRSSD